MGTRRIAYWRKGARRGNNRCSGTRMTAQWRTGTRMTNYWWTGARKEAFWRTGTRRRTFWRMGIWVNIYQLSQILNKMEKNKLGI